METRRFHIYFLVASLQMIIYKLHFADAASCENNRFGQNCQFQCHCAGGGTCSNGVCGQCDDSWEGNKCQIGKNFAKNKTVTLISKLPHWNHDAKLAVDGNTNRDFYKGKSCVATDLEQNPWLRVDLNDTYVVNALTVTTVSHDLFYVHDVYINNDVWSEWMGHPSDTFLGCLELCLNRTDCKAVTGCTHDGCWRVNPGVSTWRKTAGCKFSERIDQDLTKLSIRIGKESSISTKNHMCKSDHLNIPGDREEQIACDQQVIGRYVFLQTHDTQNHVLAVCEVKVKGYKFVECKRGFSGITCEDSCSLQCSLTGCNKFNQTCCSRYKTGAHCDKDLPSLNEKPSGAAESPSVITVTWKRWIEGSTGTGVGPVNKYHVQYKAKSFPAWTGINHETQTQNGQHLSKRSTGLHHNTIYSFRVACYLTDGLGDVFGEFTKATDIKTPCIEPSKVVLEANSISSSLSGIKTAKMIVSWSDISNANSGCDKISSYKVKYRQKGTEYQIQAMGGDTRLSVSINDLEVFTEYEIKVEAFNNENNMSTSDVLVYRTPEGYSEEISSPIVMSPAADKLLVSWNAPAQSRGVITHYKLQSRQTAIGDCDNTEYGWSQVVSANKKEYTFRGLSPYRRYKVKITPVNGAGNGTSTTTSGITLQSVPSGAPNDVKLTNEGKRSVVFEWNEVPCEQRNGIVTGYAASIFGLEFSSINKTTQINTRTIQILSLTPYARYSFKVTAVTEAGAGLYSDDVIFRTSADVPPAPRDVDIPNIQSTSFSVKWTAPYPPHGVIRKYQVRYQKADEPPLNQTTEPNVTSLHVNKLETNVNYTIRIRARTDVGWGNWSTAVYAFTVEGAPSEPRSFRTTHRSATSLSISWVEPKYPNGKITGYKIQCNGEDKEVEGSSLKTIITGLESGSKYNCSIQARTSAGYGQMSTSFSVWTLPERLKTPEPDRDMEVILTDSSITFTVPNFDKNKVSSFEVYVDKEDSGRKKRAVLSQNGGNYSGCSKDPDERDVYITAEQKPDDAKSAFTVGDGKMYGAYWNCPLIKDNSYSIFYAAVVKSLNGEEARTFVSVGKYKTKDEEPPSKDWMIILVVCVVLVLLIVTGAIAIVIYRRRMSKKSPDASSVPCFSLVFKKKSAGHRSSSALQPPAPLHPVVNVQQAGGRNGGDNEIQAEVIYANAPLSQESFQESIHISDLLDYIKRKREDKNELFKNEYESLPSGLQESLPHTFGSKPENRPKNRFANIMTYDHSRVVLEKLPDDMHSDYINAGFIDGYRKAKKFIACQGATKAMISDIWRMVWQYSINRIVMVTNLVENGTRKCDQYWPDDENDHVYAGITVHLESCEILSDFSVRTFTISKEDKTKTVRQFHYTAWPDHGVPDHATSLLSFRRKIQSFDKISKGPIVVHCSAGVGRTGTFIALDYLLEQAKAEQKVSAYTYVEYMRRQRVNMIQTLDQYIFLHSAIFEGIRCGDTIVTPPQFLEGYGDFIKINPQTSMSKLGQQFELLQSMRLTLDPRSLAAGKLSENVDKNRDMDILPVNAARPFLSTPVINTTDYINAIYINGYKQKDAFIVTQMPFPHTSVDLYRLLLEHKSNCVVMINSIDAQDETCIPYWPEDGSSSSRFGPFTVDLASTELKTDSLVVQQLSLLYKTKTTEIKQNIKHFQIKDWPMTAEAPSSAGTILNVLDMVDRWQQQTGNGPITVHCYDGASRSGVFIAVSYILEKLKLEQEIDIFNATRHIQIRRPQLIGSEAQYKFCHDAVVEYLKSFDTYSNFI